MPFNMFIPFISSNQHHVSCHHNIHRIRKFVFPGTLKHNYPPLKLTNRTWKWMLGIRISFWGKRPIFKGKQTVSFREYIPSQQFFLGSTTHNLQPPMVPTTSHHWFLSALPHPTIQRPPLCFPQHVRLERCPLLRLSHLGWWSPTGLPMQ